MDKKNIDELFREKFKTFGEVPNEKVWTAIENSLDKKRKRRVIPFWFQLGGVAAVLAIALVAFYTLKDSGEDVPTITDTEKTNTDTTKQDIRDTEIKEDEKDALQIPETTEDAVANGSSDAGSKNTEKYTKSKVDKSSFPHKLSNTDVTEAEAASSKDNLNKDPGKKKNSSNRSPDKIQLATSGPDNKGDDTDKNNIKEDNNNIPAKDKTNVLIEGDSGTVAITDADTSEKTDTSKTNIKKKTQDGIEVTQGTSEIIFEKSDKAIAQNNQIKKNDSINDTIVKDNKKSIFEALEAQNEEAEIIEESGSRWSAGPNVAPVYFDAMGEGSPIDPGFSPNAKTGSTNLSFGLSIAYAVTKKLSLRSGIYKAEYGYNTNGVGFSPTLAASASGGLQNIDYVGGPENLALNDAISDSGSPNALAPEFSALNSLRDGRVAQQFGYLEVPLELDYALIDHRLGVNLIGGISSLFLIDNSVTLSSGELTTEIGKARNLNDLNFSTNVGFGINYKFTPKVQLNIEPVFKYQLNTFSNVSGDFRPYSIGVYSGLNFKF